MKKLLTILLLIPIFTFGQGINERYDFGWSAQVFSSINEYDDSLIIIGGGVETVPFNRSHFYLNKRVENFVNIPSTESTELTLLKSALVNFPATTW